MRSSGARLSFERCESTQDTAAARASPRGLLTVGFWVGEALAVVTAGASSDAATEVTASPARVARRLLFTWLSNRAVRHESRGWDCGDTDHCTSSQSHRPPSMDAELQVRAAREPAPFGRSSAQLS